MEWQASVLAERQRYQRRFFFKTYSGEKTYTTHGCANRLPAVTSYSELKSGAGWATDGARKSIGTAWAVFSYLISFAPYAITPRTNALKTSEI
jgi:hypothetical protein